MSYSFKSPVYRDDSETDEDYTDSEIMSPTLPADFQTSPSDSDGMSAEQTPTYSQSGRDGLSPKGNILEWSADQCADFVADLGLEKYADSFVDESITGDALVALVHSDLKEMGIHSIGHRLQILKSVYDIKVKYSIPIEPEHFVPLSAETENVENPPTHDDIARIIHIIKDRDAEIQSLREDLARISEDNRKLREDFLPLIKVAKDRSQPLPTPEDNLDTKSGGLSRKFSNKRIFLRETASTKNPSPTIQEGRIADASSLDPSAAALAASSHLTASMRDGIGSPGHAPERSPTSPAYRDVSAPPGSGGPPSRPFPRSENSDYGMALPTPALSTSAGSVFTPPTSNPAVQTPGSGSSGGPQVEIFKSFRVSIDDPCHKVLPVALKKYNITADWRQYALYIVHGDQERCLGLNEKPLILFKQLDKEGRKPMFMLRKHAAPAEGTVSVGGGPPQTVNSIPGGII